MTRVEYRVTRQDDFIRFHVRIEEGARWIGWTAWAGRRAVALGGVTIVGNKAWGHFGAMDDYRELVLRGLHRRTLKLLRRLDRAGLGDIRATCEDRHPRAAEWMRRLGFMPTDEAVDGVTVHLRRV